MIPGLKRLDAAVRVTRRVLTEIRSEEVRLRPLLDPLSGLTVLLSGGALAPLVEALGEPNNLVDVMARVETHKDKTSPADYLPSSHLPELSTTPLHGSHGLALPDSVATSTKGPSQAVGRDAPGRPSLHAPSQGQMGRRRTASSLTDVQADSQAVTSPAGGTTRRVEFGTTQITPTSRKKAVSAAGSPGPYVVTASEAHAKLSERMKRAGLSAAWSQPVFVSRPSAALPPLTREKSAPETDRINQRIAPAVARAQSLAAAKGRQLSYHNPPASPASSIANTSHQNLEHRPGLSISRPAASPARLTGLRGLAARAAGTRGIEEPHIGYTEPVRRDVGPMSTQASTGGRDTRPLSPKTSVGCEPDLARKLADVLRREALRYGIRAEDEIA